MKLSRLSSLLALCFFLVLEGVAQPSPVGLKAGTTRRVRRVPKASVVWIPPGAFRMGSPFAEKGRALDEGQRDVVLRRGFWMWQTEVTQQQYRAVTGQSPSYFRRCGRTCPVESVTWYEALSFANRLSRRHRLPSCYRCWRNRWGRRCRLRRRFRGVVTACRGWRLPTEAEWEYAARAGQTGATYGKRKRIAWFQKNSRDRVHPVGRKLPNSWRLFDMLGNVAEWVWDRYKEYPKTKSVDPVGPARGRDRVFRGGGWKVSAPYVRAAYRGGNRPYSRYDMVGFRVVYSGSVVRIRR